MTLKRASGAFGWLSSKYPTYLVSSKLSPSKCLYQVQWQDEIEVVVVVAIVEEVVAIEVVAVVTTEAFEAGEVEDAVEGLCKFIRQCFHWNLAEVS